MLICPGGAYARCSRRDSFENLVGHYPGTPEEMEFFSCGKRGTERTPCTLLWHTAADMVVPVMNSLFYASALAEHGVPFELHVIPYGGHGLSTVDIHANDTISPEADDVKDWLPAMKKRLDRYFKIS